MNWFILLLRFGKVNVYLRNFIHQSYYPFCINLKFLTYLNAALLTNKMKYFIKKGFPLNVPERKNNCSRPFLVSLYNTGLSGYLGKILRKRGFLIIDPVETLDATQYICVCFEKYIKKKSITN